MKKNQSTNNELKFEKIISYLLLGGIIISILLEVIGVALLYHSSGNLNISHEPGVYIKGHDFFSFIYQQFQNIRTIKPAILFMTMGIVVLILTPYMRVIASFLFFSWQRNYKYILITLFVLVVVTLSLTLH
jgi:uncharacterized membrane protein